MCTFPIGVFYIFYYLIFAGDVDMIGWSGVAAVVAVNMVIYMYVRMAWLEPNEEIDEDKKDNKMRRRVKRTD
jgi:hypothetical protein